MDSTKDLILESLRRNRQAGDFPHPEIPDFPKSERPILDEFKESLTAGGGTWREAASAAEAEGLIRKLHPDAKVICSAAPEIRGNRDIHAIKDPHELDDVDVGVIRARFGVAETGMVWLRIVATSGDPARPATAGTGYVRGIRPHRPAGDQLRLLHARPVGHGRHRCLHGAGCPGGPLAYRDIPVKRQYYQNI